ncbi:MAG: ACT domain-containing protein [Acidobacteriota bacterium]|nr:ACT domain-containing protein [Acidobacteriota bacterium]
MILNLDLLEGTFAVVRLEPEASVPAWARGGALWSITQTPDELSILCASERVPQGFRIEGPFRALRVQGPLDMAMIGVLAAIADPLANAGISIFAVSTFDTDYVLVREADLEAALKALRLVGHQVA